MTIKSWRKEFMPKLPTKGLTKIKSIEHSLRKWKGLTEENLKKHGLEKEGYWLQVIGESAANAIDIDADTCALCVKFYDSEFIGSQCLRCPLYITLGRPCDKYQTTSPYNVWLHKGNPLPMIEALQKTLDRELEKL